MGKEGNGQGALSNGPTQSVSQSAPRTQNSKKKETKQQGKRETRAKKKVMHARKRSEDAGTQGRREMVQVY